MNNKRTARLIGVVAMLSASIIVFTNSMHCVGYRAECARVEALRQVYLERSKQYWQKWHEHPYGITPYGEWKWEQEIEPQYSEVGKAEEVFQRAEADFEKKPKPLLCGCP